MIECGVWPETIRVMARIGFTAFNSVRAIDDETVIDKIGKEHNLIIGQINALKGLVRYVPNAQIGTTTGGFMAEKHKRAIQERLYVITEHITEPALNHMLRYLHSKSAITEDEVMECSRVGTSYKDRTASLLQYIMKKSNADFFHLVDAFHEAGKKVLGELLTEGGSYTCTCNIIIPFNCNFSI